MLNAFLSLKKFVAPVAIVALLGVTLISAQEGNLSGEATVSQTTDFSYPEQQAIADARTDVNSGVWFLAGCLLGAMGWLAAYLIESNPPATRLLGKSHEYIIIYTDAYRAETRRIQASKAFSGCLVSTLIGVVLEVVAIAVAVTAAESAESSY